MRGSILPRIAFVLDNSVDLCSAEEIVTGVGAREEVAEEPNVEREAQ